MYIPKRLGRPLAAVAVSAAMAGTALVAAPAAQAYDTGHTKISCSAVKVRAKSTTSSAVKGIAYKGDSMAYNLWVYQKAKKLWWTKGVVTRRSDGAKISGYVVYDCANPYQSNPAPKPPIPK